MEQFTRVGAYAVCVDDQDRMLLVRIAPGSDDPGSWTLPGGGIDFGEDPADAVVRELEEETGLTGRITALLGIDSRVFRLQRPQGEVEAHAIRIVYRVEITGGTLRDEIGGSSDTCAWLSPDEAAATGEVFVELVEAGRRMGEPSRAGAQAGVPA